MSEVDGSSVTRRRWIIFAQVGLTIAIVALLVATLLPALFH